MAYLSTLMMLLAALLMTVGIPSFVLGQIVLPGECPKYLTQPKFNPAQVKLNFSLHMWYYIIDKDFFAC